MAQSFSVNVAGVWKAITAPAVNVAGAWKNIQQGWVNVGGVWDLFFSAASAFSLTAGVSGNDRGYVSGGFGSLTPTTFTDGTILSQIYTSTPGTDLTIYVTGTGITAAYLASVTLNGATLLGSAAAFSFGGASGQWIWSGGISALTGGTTYPVSIVTT